MAKKRDIDEQDDDELEEGDEDESTEEEESESEDEGDVEDEFDDEFEDEFAEGDGDGDDDLSFGPVYVQGETSVNFDAYAMIAAVLVTALSAYLLYSTVLTEVYDGANSAPLTLKDYNGLGQKGGGDAKLPEKISYAPQSVQILGLGKYDASSANYDFAILNAGTDNGLDIGVVFLILPPGTDPKTASLSSASKRLVVVAAEKSESRADFITFEDSGSDSNKTISAKKVYTDYKNEITYRKGDSKSDPSLVYAQIKANPAAPTARPGRPPLAPRLQESLVREALVQDPTARYHDFIDANPEWNIIKFDSCDPGAATSLVASPESQSFKSSDTSDGKASFGYLFYRVPPRAYLAPPADQKLLVNVLDVLKKAISDSPETPAAGAGNANGSGSGQQ